VTLEQETLVRQLLDEISWRDIKLFRRSINKAAWADRQKEKEKKHQALLDEKAFDRALMSYSRKSSFSAHLAAKRNQ
jgi:hypothetical protein